MSNSIEIEAIAQSIRAALPKEAQWVTIYQLPNEKYTIITSEADRGNVISILHHVVSQLEKLRDEEYHAIRQN